MSNSKNDLDDVIVIGFDIVSMTVPCERRPFTVMDITSSRCLLNSNLRKIMTYLNGVKMNFVNV